MLHSTDRLDPVVSSSSTSSPRSRALAAAVRVALGSALVVACGGRLANETEGATAPSQDPGHAASSQTASAQPPAAPLPCDARLAATFPDGGAPYYVNDTPPSTDPALIACCNELAAKLSPATRTEAIRSSGCCHVAFDGEASSACTPWGPPVPPAMRAPSRLS
jgi:hypothetical protein